MKNEELLSDIKDSCPDDPMCQNCSALVGVVALHKPFLSIDEKLKCGFCGTDSGWFHLYPCKTIEIIERELSE